MQNNPNFLVRLIALLDARSIASFLTVGSLSAALYFLSFTLFWKFFHLHYQMAVSFAYVLSVVFHFTANRRFTFRAHGHRFPSQIVKYLTMVLVNYLITMVVVHFVVEVLHGPPYVGVACTIAATTGIGFMLSKFWIFRVV